MKTVFSSILIIDSIVALYLFFSPIWERKKLDSANKALHLYALASAIWSLGFGMLFLQVDPEKAYFWRSLAIFGTVLYMITVQFLICQFAQISRKLQHLFNFIALTGVIPYLLSIQRDQTEYFMSAFGMTYRFKPGIVNTIYTFYFVLVSVNILGIIIHMIVSSEKKRLRVFGKHFLLITILILLGTILDMIFPAVGLPALPGSNVTQFLGLIILFYAMDVMNRTTINVSNMSEFIYYSLAMPVLVFDENYQLRIANEAASEFLSLPKDTHALADCRIEKLFSTQPSKDCFSFEDAHYNEDTVCRMNQVPCNLTISKIRDHYQDIIGYIVIVQDLTERMQYIEELKKARQEADSSNSAKSRFLANMSHEIRTPMNAIIGFSELALQENPSPVLTDYLEDIKVSSHNLMTLINDILDFSKIESGKMTLVNINYDTADFFKDIYQMIHTQASQKGLDFQVVFDSNLPRTLSGDSNRLRSILINLLNNAVKYTPSGFIRLEVRCPNPTTSPFALELRVSDSGIGIKEEELSHLFEAFARLDQTRNYGTEGTGLGLALVKGYCSLMNGSIRVESVYGKGSTFIATVEQVVVDATPIDRNLIHSHHIKDEFSLGTLKVHDITALIVDDTPINLKVISRSMTYYGMTIDVASGGEEAIEMCRKKAYNLVFMDQMMPKMDGIEAMKRIRTISSHYAPNGPGKIIVLTANAIAGVREELLAEGFDEYLSKPVNYRKLEVILRHFIPNDYWTTDVLEEEAALKEGTTVVSQEKEAITQEALTAMLSPINVSEGITFCGGTIEDYLEILQMMYADSKQQLDLLYDDYQAQNWKDFTITIHSIKGSCSNIGADSTAESAKELEMAGRREDASFIAENLPAFREKYRYLMSLLLAVFTKWEIPVGTGEASEAMPPVKEMIELFKQAVEGYDFASASAALKKAKAAPDADGYTDLLGRLDEMMEDMDINGMLTLLS